VTPQAAESREARLTGRKLQQLVYINLVIRPEMLFTLLELAVSRPHACARCVHTARSPARQTPILCKARKTSISGRVWQRGARNPSYKRLQPVHMAWDGNGQPLSLW